MRYQSGDHVPPFEVTDVHGRLISTTRLKGRPWLLSFFRFSTCALCNLRIHELIQKYPRYHAQGLEVVAVFESPAANVIANVGKQKVPFALVADPEARLYDAFGVETSATKVQASSLENLKPLVEAAASLGYPLFKEDGANFFRMPADILVGPDGVVAEAFYSEAIGSHLAFETIERHLLASGE